MDPGGGGAWAPTHMMEGDKDSLDSVPGETPASSAEVEVRRPRPSLPRRARARDAALAATRT